MGDLFFFDRNAKMCKNVLPASRLVFSPHIMSPLAFSRHSNGTFFTQPHSTTMSLGSISQTHQ